MRKILSLILGLLWTLPVWGALPTGYTELEYIESTGTQYIDTQYTMTNTSGIKIVIDDTATNSPRASTAAYFVGSALQGSYMGYFTRVSSNMVASVWAWNGENVLGNDITSTHSTVYINYMNDRKFIYNNGTRDYVREGDLPTLKDATSSLYLFNTSSGGSVYRGVGKMYSAQITENQSIVRNLVPAQRNSDGAVGLYDTVNDVFYENKGTGSFIAGPEACDGTVVNYVSATGTVSQSGTPTPTNPIDPVFYTQGDMILRAVGDYKDSYDATTGKITRRVGVRVLNGTEDWNYNYVGFWSIRSSEIKSSGGKIYCTHFESVDSLPATDFRDDTCWAVGNNISLGLHYGKYGDIDTFKQWLAEQYANGTPVTVWYPLETETTEDWAAEQCSSPIKIATTKYNETAFSPLNAALQNAISVVDSVVSNTITQAASIATLQAQKQTRPNDIADDSEKCPAGKKCLLVEDASGVPHWYEIVERYSSLPDGYTELQWIESTGTQWIDTGIVPSSDLMVEYTFQLMDATGLAVLFGSSKGTGNDYPTDTQIWVETSGFYIANCLASGTGHRCARSRDSNIHSVTWNSLSDGKVLFDNAVIGNYLPYTSNGKNIYIAISNHPAMGTYNKYKQRVYSATFTNKTSGALLRNFIPVKNSSGVVGMYDTVSGTFFENAGTGSFVAGPVAE